MQKYNQETYCNVDIKFAGICGSDINKCRTGLITKHNVLYYGHEIVGKYYDGKKAIPCIVNPFICDCDNHLSMKECNQKSCAYCMHVKKIGSGDFRSGFSGRISIPRTSVYPLQDVKNIEVGVLADGIAVVYHTLHIHCPERQNHILVIGAGCLGILYVIVIANTMNVSHIDLYVKDHNKKPYLESILPKNVNILTKEQITTDSYDVVIEAVGGEQTESLSMAINCIKTNGSLIVLGAFNESTDRLNCIRKMFYKQVQIQGVNSFCIKHNDFSKAVQFVSKNESVLLPLLTDKYYCTHNTNASKIVKMIQAPKLLKGYIQYG